MVKQRTERNLLFPSKEFRDRVRLAAKERGFRSEQAFILAACKNELARGDSTEATAQLQTRIAATLANTGKQVQSLFTLVHGRARGADIEHSLKELTKDILRERLLPLFLDSNHSAFPSRLRFHYRKPRSLSILGFSSCTASRLWQAAQSLEIVRPSALVCDPSWHRKQPGKSL